MQKKEVGIKRPGEKEREAGLGNCAKWKKEKGNEKS